MTLPTQNDPLDYLERLPFCRHYNSGGYVLDFSNATFDQFCIEAIGYSLLEKYQASKGKSLEAFLGKAPRSKSIRLIEALMAYEDSIGWDDPSVRVNLTKALDAIKVKTSMVAAVDELQAAGFTSEYVEMQRFTMSANIDVNPTLAIGLAKEYLETCLKSIAEERRIEVKQNANVPQLQNAVMEELGLAPKQVNNEMPGATELKKLLGSLISCSDSIAAIRNKYGSGHGKEKDFVSLLPRDARLVVSVSIMVCDYLWDFHQAKPKPE